MRYRVLLILLVLTGMALLTGAQDDMTSDDSIRLFCTESPFNQPVPEDAFYLPEDRIGSFRQNEIVWSVPIYRVPADEDHPLVEVVNNYSGRTEYWRIPTYADPAEESDHHMAVIYEHEQVLYEMWDAQWVEEDRVRINAGGMKKFPLNGNAISFPPNRRVTAAGFAVTAGAVTRENFTDPETGELDPDARIQHALSMSLNFDIVEKDAFIYPAIGGEVAGRVTDGTGIPMGARFALSPDLTEADLAGYHPLTRALALAARDYGIFVNDTNGSPPYNDKYVGNVRIEPGLVEDLWDIDNDEIILDIQSEMFEIIDAHGIYQVVTTPPDIPEGDNCPKEATTSEGFDESGFAGE